MATNPGSPTFESLSRWVQASGLPLFCDLARSQGAYLFDTQSGREYLDLFGYFGSRPLAFNHPKLADPDFVQKLGQIAQHKPSNCDVYTPEYAAFADTFGRVALGGHFEHLFFIEGGAPAVENAVKAAIDWKHRKNLGAGRGTKGSQIIHFRQGFHGRTGYALSLTDPFDSRKTEFFPTFKWPRVLNPAMHFPFDAAAEEAVTALEQQSLAEIDAAFDQHQDDIAAIIIETIQGEGGDNYFRPEFLQALRRVCDEREALLIFDEIQTGFGATGCWWDWQHAQVRPDLMVFGKKAGVCGFAATERLNEVESVFHIPSRISSTFEGNLVDMVRCTRVIEIIEEDKLLKNARQMGDYTLKCLHKLSESFAEITSVRGRGLWSAFDMPSTQARDKLVKACFGEYLLVLPCGEKSVRMRPALDIRADAIGRGAALLEVALKRTRK